jgi:hypothetical protein
MGSDGKPAASDGSSSAENDSSDERTDGKADAAEDRDVVYVHSRCNSGEGYNVIRSRPGQLEIGELRELRSGQPISGDVVKLTPSETHERVYDVEVLAKAPKARSHPGPAHVTTDAYRERWDAIFGSKRRQAEGSSELN